MKFRDQSGAEIPLGNWLVVLAEWDYLMLILFMGQYQSISRRHLEIWVGL